MSITPSARQQAVFGHADGLLLGCDYNPEQWDREVWREDMALMREAGVSLVAINVFGWSQINPAPGVWDFDDLDAIMDLLADAGIGVNLGTGTASTPAWLTSRHPELLPVADDGTRRFPGGRQAWCPSSPVYREHAQELVRRVSERYASHPALRMWHVSNELGCHNALCYCEASTVAFRDWLRARYGTVDALNAAWGTTFWSQRYASFDDVLTPMRTLSSRNPGHVLDFHRFSSDELLQQYRMERTAIREHSDAPVTTNFMVTAHIRNLDYWSWASEMDVVANDHYLDHRLGSPITEMEFAADLTRGLAGGEPWILMETATGAVNWQPLNVNRAPGELKRHALTHIARGADAVCFFQWRASLQGSEKFHSAMVPHAGTDSRVWREVLDLGVTLRALDAVKGSRVAERAALVFDWASWWAVDAENTPSAAVTYLDQVHAAYAAARAAGIGLDLVPADAHLDSYDMILVPALHSVSDANASKISGAAQRGATVVVTFLSGTVDEQDRVRTGGYPGAFRDLLGIRVDEFNPIAPDETIALASGASARLWAEPVMLRGAEAVDSFASGPCAGSPAVTRHASGQGEAWYVATALDPVAYAGLLARIADEASLVRHPGVSMTRRSTDTETFVFAINHSEAPVTVELNGTDVVSGERYTGTHVLDGGAAIVVREESA